MGRQTGFFALDEDHHAALEAILDEINRKYRFIATVVVTRDGRFLARVGDAREPVWNDPYNVFFRDAETIANTFAFLDAAPPPQGLTQEELPAWLADVDLDADRP